ncbi:MAG: hypothetical protein O2973_12615, partial [Gemmatimonadetes bacterium]|nr:hypothetical protein [Gemmatimonadota bacterium]
EPMESPTIARVPVAAAPEAGFAAFLDGIQRSVVVGHFDATIPVVHATVAAAIRERKDRSLHTWGAGATVKRALFLPVALVPAAAVDELCHDGFAVVDTTPAGDRSGHPHELLGFARQAIQQRREAAEAGLARDWCATEHRPLYVDGGIGAFADASRSELAVGVIKSHHTLYVDAAAVPTVASLAPGERTTAFLVATRVRTRVASWYLRTRVGDGIDPFSGIVRVEVAEAGFSAGRADQVSAWVLAEREPVALPDPRWRAMAYGVRDCEQYLRAVAG